MSSLAVRTPPMTARGPWSGIHRWLEALPHPEVAIEFAPGQVTGSRGRRRLESLAVEPLPEGALTPSPVDNNIENADAVSAVLERVARRIGAQGEEAALLLPDPVVRVFLPRFEQFPRREQDAVPLLRWRLRKSVPFDVEETQVSYRVQGSGAGGVEVLVALARQRIVRQYEALAEAAGLLPGVVLGSTLAALPLLEESRSVLLARLAGRWLTTAIVAGEALAVYRCTEMGAGAAALEPQGLLEEIYPAVTYFQDSHRGSLEQVRLAGFLSRVHEFAELLEQELGCPAGPLAVPPAMVERLTGDTRAVADGPLVALAGWMLNENA